MRSTSCTSSCNPCTSSKFRRRICSSSITCISILWSVSVHSPSVHSFSPALPLHATAYKARHYSSPSLLLQYSAPSTTISSPDLEEGNIHGNNGITKSDTIRISSTEELNQVLKDLCNTNALEKAKELLLSIEEVSLSHHLRTTEKNTRVVAADIASYTIVISAFAKTPKSKEGYEMYKRLQANNALETGGGLNNHVIEVNTICNNAVLDGLATSGDYEAANELVMEMRQSSRGKPDVISYNSVLNAYATKGLGEEAQAFLIRMWDEYKSSGNRRSKPNEISYATALSAWARNSGMGNDGQAAQKAEDLLEVMQQWSKQEEVDVAYPTIFCVNTVLHAWSKTYNGAPSAERMLRRMILLKKSSIQPNTVSYNTVMAAWAKHTSKEAPIHAESLLKEMQSSADGGITPNLITFNTVMDAWARHSKLRNGAKRAEEILRYMEYLYSSTHDEKYKPDVRSYSTVINAYAQSRCRGSAAKASKVLDDMLKNDLDTPPNSVVFNTVINAWSKSGETDAAVRAHAILDHMEQTSQSNLPNYKPDYFSYTSVIDAYAKIGTIESASQASKLLDKMETLFEETKEETIQPNVKTYTSLLNAYSRSKQPQKAADVLMQMDTFSSKYAIPNLQVDVIMYNALVNAWGWSDDHMHKAYQAYQIYQSMKGYQGITPDVVTINSLLNACAFTKILDKKIQANVLHIAIECFEEVTNDSSKIDIQPNDTTYGTMLCVIGNLVHSDNIALRNELIQSTFWKCCKDGYVSYYVISQLRNALQQSSSWELYKTLVLDSINDPDLSGKKDSSKEKSFGFVDITKLPKEWTSHTIRNTNGRKCIPYKKRV